MADTAVAVTAGSGTNIDTRTESTNGNHRQVIVVGDPATNAGVAPVDATAGLKVDLGADNDVTVSGVSTATKQDTIIGHLDGVEGLLTTIDADTSALNGAISGTEVQVDIVSAPTLTVNSHAVTNAGTFATQVDGAALTALQLIDDVVYTDDTSTHATGTSKGALIMAAAVPTDTSVSANDIAAVAMTTDRKLHVAVMDALPAGTAAIGKLAANSGVDIGDVDVASIAAGDNNIGNVDIASALPAGTNAIGKLAANSGVDIGDVDVTSLPALAAGTNAVGKLLPPDIDVTAHTNYAKKYYTNSGAVTDGIVWSPAAGKRWHVVTMYIQTSADATVTLEDDKAGGDEAVWKGEIAAKSGVVVPWGEKYPLASGEDAADLIVTTSAGNIYITCTGYEI